MVYIIHKSNPIVAAIVLLMCLMLLPHTIVAIPSYEKGYQELTIGIGTLMPSAKDNSDIPAISIDWQKFVHPYVSVGVNTGLQISDMQAYGIELPMVLKFQYLPFKENLCDVVFSTGVGICIDFNGRDNIRLFANIPVEMAMRVFVSDSFAIGASAGIITMSDILSAPIEISAFMPIRATGTYIF